MHRFALDLLLRKLAVERPKPIVLRGARQVGKSFLVRMVADAAGLDLVEVNLEKTKISEFDNKQDFDIKKVIAEIELLTKKRISQNSLVFIDELQAQPSSVGALRYFYEDADPYLKVIAAGSLLEVMLEREKLNMPVGRLDYFFLGPMTFEEFLLALKEDQLLEQIQKLSIDNYPLGALHRRTMEMLRKFYFVGGMPEAVRVYAESGDFSKVRVVHDSIRLTYQDDISKYTKGQERTLVESVFNYTPLNLGKTVVYKDISNTHSSRVRGAIEVLARANVVYMARNNKASGLPLRACADPSTIKLYFLDIGLYNSATGLQWQELFNLPADELITKGFMAEQFIAQHLVFRRGDAELTELYYWLRGGQEGAAEIDFLISEKGKIYPVEVKSGATGKMRSLWQYVAAKDARVVVRFDLSERKRFLSQVRQKVVMGDGTKEIQTDMLCLPVYAVSTLSRILEEYTAMK